MGGPEDLVRDSFAGDPRFRFGETSREPRGHLKFKMFDAREPTINTKVGVIIQSSDIPAPTHSVNMKLQK